MNRVNCHCHGESDYGLVCIHLDEQKDDASPLKYYWGESEPTDASRSEVENVWCEACDEILISENEWNEVSEGYADIQVVCLACLAEIKSRNIQGILD